MSVTSGVPLLGRVSNAGVARLTLNRPESRNALSAALVRELDEALAWVADDPYIRVVVLAAEGPVFSSGHDLSELVGRTDAEYEGLFSACTRMMQRLGGLPQPVIARVQGPALAAGCQLVAGCDLVVAANTATFSTPGVKIGLFCATPMVPLMRVVPPRAALEMLLTGESITAEQARALGLVNRVVPWEGLDEAINGLIAPILSASAEVVRQGKAAFRAQRGRTESEGYALATSEMVRGALKPDAQEGITAFLEKRPPRWPRGA